MGNSFFRLVEGGTVPLAAAAIHNGHRVRPDIIAQLNLDNRQRLQEEDPHTGLLAQVAPIQLIGQHSRFEVDLNRPRDKAVYVTPDDAWGLQVWKSAPDSATIRRSLAEYDRFYRTVEDVLSRAVQRYGYVIVFDIHSYNHRRKGPQAPPDDPAKNPEINVGTGTMCRSHWAPVVDGFIRDLRSFAYQGRHLDVRENVKFYGGYLCRWIHERFPTSACALAVEFKKFFMDEWTGEADYEQLRELAAALQFTVPGCLRQMERLQAGATADCRQG